VLLIGVCFLNCLNVIGCPDCADGGGEWIEVSVAGESHRVTFDNGANIEAIQPLIELMRSHA
jgi:hypothetical protein